MLFDLGIAVEKVSLLFVFKIVSDWDAFGIPDPCANSIGRYRTTEDRISIERTARKQLTDCYLFCKKGTVFLEIRFRPLSGG
jgi:hypothetical protein